MGASAVSDALSIVVDELMRHHELVVNGLAGGEAEDDLLAKGDASWYRLTRAEQRQAAAVSEALLTAEDDVDTEPPLVTGAQATEAEEKLRRAPDPAECLLILCREPSGVPLLERAYYRARLLHQMGFDAVATALRRRALILAESDPERQFNLLSRLCDDGFADDLVDSLCSFVARCDQPSLLLGAGELLSGASIALADIGLAVTACEAHERALRGHGDLDDHLRAVGLANWATASMLVGDRATARALFNEAIGIKPMSDQLRGQLLYARGMLRFEDDPADTEDLQAAIDLNTASPVPYLVLARAALDGGDRLKCHELAERALRLNPPPPARAVARDLLARAKATQAAGSAAMERALAPALPKEIEEPIMAVP